MKYCVQCGEECADNAEYCLECGHPNFAPENIKYCASCGTSCELLGKYCLDCGSKEFYYVRGEYDRKKYAEEEAARQAVEEKEAEQRRLQKINTDYEFCNGELKKYKGNDAVVEIPANVCYKIGEHAFENCGFIQEVIIPDNIREIGSYAFDGCKNLKKVNIPDGVTELGYRAFGGCDSLEKIKLPSNLSYMMGAFNECHQLKEVVIPEGITEIMDSTFYECGSLSEIKLPKSLKKIGDHAFSNCYSLKEIFIPKVVEEIGNRAFYKCPELTIYAETAKQPNGWFVKKGFLGFGIKKEWGIPLSWNPDERPVVWGYIAPQKPDGRNVVAPCSAYLKKWLVEDGARVTEGQGILLFEAMKMESKLYAQKDGEIHFLIEEFTDVEEGTLIAVIE